MTVRKRSSTSQIGMTYFLEAKKMARDHQQEIHNQSGGTSHKLRVGNMI